MKILIVCSANSGRIMPLITEQGNELVLLGHTVDYFSIKGKGVLGYLRNFGRLKTKISENKFDIVHAHYGLSGALAILQRKVPVVITFHNGETLTKQGNTVASIASLFSSYNIYVAQHIFDLTYFKKKSKSMILPCGVNFDDLTIIPKELAIAQMGLPTDKTNILFGGSFLNLRKNVKLAQQALQILNRDDINLIELSGYNRQQVTNLLCGCDLMLLPSISEGSPQIVKEAMACNCPIVATDIADIKVLFGSTEGCYLTSFDTQDVASKINQAIEFGKRTDGRKQMNSYDNKMIIAQIIELYKRVVNK